MLLTDYIDTLPEIRHHAEGSLVDVERLYRERGGDFHLCPRHVRDRASRWTYVLLLVDTAEGIRARVWVTIETAHPKGRLPYQFEGYVMCRQDEANRYRFNPEHIVRFLQ